MNPKQKRLFSRPVSVLLGCATLLSVTVQAGHFDGDAGAGDPSWNNALNWSDNLVPTASTLVQAIDVSGAKGYGVEVRNAGAVAASVDVGIWGHPGLMTVVSGGTLAISGNMRVALDAGADSSLTHDGEMTIGGNLQLGEGNSFFNMNGGTVDVAGSFFMTEGGIGRLNLHGGTIMAAGLGLSTNGDYTIDITKGVLIAGGNHAADLRGMVEAGFIAAYGGAGDVVVEYNAGLDQTTLRVPSAPYGPVAVQNGGFTVKKTGAQFFPVGFNYVDLRTNGVGSVFHDTFNPNHYVAATVSSNLTEIAAAGFNTVRVFIDASVDTNGVVAAWSDTELSSAYMLCVADFLEQAYSHEIYVLITLNMLPGSAAYNPYFDTVANIEYPNVVFMNPGWIKAERLFVRDFIQALVQLASERLVDTVFAFDLSNEVAHHLGWKPFSLSSGTVTPVNGKTYDLATDKALLSDEMAVYWVDQMAEEVWLRAPGVLVDVNTFTYHAVHRSIGDFSLRGAVGADDWRDRYPFRPEVLADSGADFYDMHAYTADAAGLQAEIDSIDFPATSNAWSTAGKPMIVGEFGSYKSVLSFSQAVDWKRDEVDVFASLGFQGWLYWTYNTDIQTRLWNAKSGTGEIFDVLAQGAKENYFGYPPAADDIDGDGMPDSWEILYFGSTSALKGGAEEDYEGDGMANRSEYQAGTHPNNPASKFMLVRGQADGTEVQVGWSTVSGKTYQLIRSESLINPHWNVAGLPGSGTGSDVFTTVPDDANQAFYKVRVNR